MWLCRVALAEHYLVKLKVGWGLWQRDTASYFTSFT